MEPSSGRGPTLFSEWKATTGRLGGGGGGGG